MRAGEARNREHVDVFLECGFNHLLLSLLEAREIIIPACMLRARAVLLR